MWKKSKHPPICTLVGEGTVFTGSIQFVRGLRIDGHVKGDVTAAPDATNTLLVISETGRVEGAVTAEHVIVNGQVVGPVHCGELLELQPHARIEGDVRYQRLEMHVGATVDGALAHVKTEEKPALKLAASNGG